MASVFEFFMESPGDKKRRAGRLSDYEKQLALQRDSAEKLRGSDALFAETQKMRDEKRLEGDLARTLDVDVTGLPPGAAEGKRALEAAKVAREIRTSRPLSEYSTAMNVYEANMADRPFIPDVRKAENMERISRSQEGRRQAEMGYRLGSQEEAAKGSQYNAAQRAAQMSTAVNEALLPYAGRAAEAGQHADIMQSQYLADKAGMESGLIPMASKVAEDELRARGSDAVYSTALSQGLDPSIAAASQNMKSAADAAVSQQIIGDPNSSRGLWHQSTGNPMQAIAAQLLSQQLGIPLNPTTAVNPQTLNPSLRLQPDPQRRERRLGINLNNIP